MVPGAPAALLGGRGGCLAIADLHLGFEASLGGGGISVGKNAPAGEAADEAIELLDRTGARTLALLGDVKSGTSRISGGEWDGVSRFLAAVCGRADTVVVPGNHDAGIHRMAPPGATVSGPGGMVVGGALLTHGHAMPPESLGHVRHIVMGHAHPAFVEEGSLLSGQRVWVTMRADRGLLFPSRGGTVEITVVPSFNRYLHAGRRGPRRRPPSPIIERVRGSAEARILTLDGAVIGDESSLGSVL